MGAQHVGWWLALGFLCWRLRKAPEPNMRGQRRPRVQRQLLRRHLHGPRSCAQLGLSYTACLVRWLQQRMRRLPCPGFLHSDRIWNQMGVLVGQVRRLDHTRAGRWRGMLFVWRRYFYARAAPNGREVSVSQLSGKLERHQCSVWLCLQCRLCRSCQCLGGLPLLHRHLCNGCMPQVFVWSACCSWLHM